MHIFVILTIMKKSIYSVLTISALFTLLLTLNSSTNGPGGNRTGSPGASGSCGSCHGGGSFFGQNKVGIVLPGDTNFLTSYTPGAEYEFLVRLKGTSTKMGFQATAILTSGSAAGTLGTAPSGTNTYMSGSKIIWGHTMPSTTGEWRIKWTAPAAGSGNISFYASAVFANNNGRDNGDQVVPGSKTITEDAANNAKSVNVETVQLLGNPVQDAIVLNERVNLLTVMNMQGKVVANAMQTDRCDASQLSPGTYFVQVINKHNAKQTFTVLVK